MITHARDISDALGGIPALAKATNTQYRLAYGWVQRDSIPAEKDLAISEALAACGSSFRLQDIAEWRARKSDNNYQPVQPSDAARRENCGEKDAATTAAE